jgi:putative transcriptional regulator
MVECTLGELLERKGKSLYSLANDIQMKYPALWRIKANKTKSIKHTTVNKICAALDCDIGDIYRYVPDRKTRTTK